MTATVLRADARSLPLPDSSVDLIVTSPPYFGLRSYTDTCNVCLAAMRDGIDPRTAFVNPSYDEHVRRHHHYDGQIGSEATPREWLAAMLECTAEWMRVLKPSGSIFVNLGDKYSGAQAQNDGRPAARGDSADFWRRTDPKRTGIPNKSLMGLPWRYALACMDDLGLILRRDIIWSKPNGLPESVTDRCRSSHEYLFHLVKQPRYYAAVDEIREAHVATLTGRDTSRWKPGPSGSREIGRGQWDKQAGEFATNPLGKLPGSVWEIPSQPLTVPAHLGVDHFAAFPMELPRRIILGWSPPGICVACGEGRRPVVDKQFRKKQESYWTRPAKRDGSEPDGNDRGFNRTGYPCGRHEATITGYACACPDATAPTRPAVVVDPFGGTGTTSLVADMLGRTGVSFDLSADYCRLARWRTRDPAERARALGVPKPPPVPDGQGDLFAEVAL